jgi:hypothetical protein
MGSAMMPAAGGKLMRAAAFNHQGSPEVLQPCWWSKPRAGPGQVLVKVMAAGLNPVDAKIRAGQVRDEPEQTSGGRNRHSRWQSALSPLLCRCSPSLP